MTSPGADFVLEILSGTGTPTQYEMTRGVELAAMSVGTRGIWAVQGDLVLPVHGFVYFDGESLFVQSASDKVQVRANGLAVKREWLAVGSPSTLEFGTVTIVFREADGRTTDRPEPPLPSFDPEEATLIKEGRQKKARRPFEPGEFAVTVDERTSIDTTPEDQAPSVRPAAGAAAPSRPPAEERPPASSPTLIGDPLPSSASLVPSASGIARPLARPIDVPPPPPIAPPPPKDPVRDAVALLKANWNALSPPKRVLVACAPLLLASVLYIFAEEEEAPAPPVAPPVASASARALKPVASAPPVIAPIVGAPSSASDGGGARTPERAAGDAVAGGEYAKAAALYDELAAANPANPTFAAAARILRAKLDAGIP